MSWRPASSLFFLPLLQKITLVSAFITSSKEPLCSLVFKNLFFASSLNSYAFKQKNRIRLPSGQSFNYKGHLRASLFLKRQQLPLFAKASAFFLRKKEYLLEALRKTQLTIKTGVVVVVAFCGASKGVVLTLSTTGFKPERPS